MRLNRTTPSATWTLTVVACVLAAASICAAQQVTYTDVTEAAGIDFRYTFGDLAYDNILESSGSGVSVLDYDGDGYMDLYLLNGTYLEDVSDPKGRRFENTPDRFYRNNGDGTFREVSQEAGLDDRYWSMAASPVDIDSDGDVDIYLLNYGPNAFLLNNGDGTFTDKAGEMGLRGPETLNGFTKWSVGSAFWDYDRDGALDVMVGNFLAFDPCYLSPTAPHLMPHPGEYEGQASLVYRQEANGRFRDVTRDLGMYRPDSKCMGITVYDYDEDGDLDVFQGNDHQENFLFQSDGQGRFRDVAPGAGVTVNDQGIPTGSMHGSVGDVDGDGLVDLLVTDLRHGALYRNTGEGLFEDITVESGVHKAFNGKGVWAAVLFDYDNDGDLDIFSANGAADLLVEQPPLLLENDGKGRFADVGKKVGRYFRELRSGRAAAVCDYDNDGDLDIIVSHVDLRATAALLRNDGGNRGHWIGLTPVVDGDPYATAGSTVVVWAGGRRRVAVHQWATSYLSYSDPRMHVGLGEVSGVDSVAVRWPGGGRDVYRDLAADRYWILSRGVSGGPGTAVPAHSPRHRERRRGTGDNDAR